MLHGEIWRLATWSLLETRPIALLFTCLFLYWFGSNLADDWGSRRFLAVYVGVALTAAIGTCAFSFVDKEIVEQRYLGSWPLAEAITVAWGLWFPTRVVRIYFVIPIKGFTLAWGTVVLTVVYAIYAGWEHFMPNLLAEGAILAWMYREPVTKRWAGWQRARSQRARQASARSKQGQRLATVHVLRRLEERDEDLAPLSPELEDQLGRIIRGGADQARVAPVSRVLPEERRKNEAPDGEKPS